MQKLVIVRHGNYGCNDQLNDSGREQISALAERLTAQINGGRLLILSSTAARARQSAEILAKKFGVSFEEHEIFWSEASHMEDFPGALEFICNRREEADVIMIVTHFEYSEGFPSFFAKKEFQSEWPFEVVMKGEAVVIDCIQRTRTYV